MRVSWSVELDRSWIKHRNRIGRRILPCNTDILRFLQVEILPLMSTTKGNLLVSIIIMVYYLYYSYNYWNLVFININITYFVTIITVIKMRINIESLLQDCTEVGCMTCGS